MFCLIVGLLLFVVALGVVWSTCCFLVISVCLIIGVLLEARLLVCCVDSSVDLFVVFKRSLTC